VAQVICDVTIPEWAFYVDFHGYMIGIGECGVGEVWIGVAVDRDGFETAMIVAARAMRKESVRRRKFMTMTGWTKFVELEDSSVDGAYFFLAVEHDIGYDSPDNRKMSDFSRIFVLSHDDEVKIDVEND